MLKKKVKIESYEVGPDGNVKLSSLMKHMQQAALDDCDQYGASYENLREEDLVFVIIKFGIRFFSPIRKNDEIEILTVNDRLESIYFVRDFVIYKDGLPAAEATTQWILIRFSTRSPMRPNSSKYPMTEMKMGLTKLVIPRSFGSDDAETTETHIVRYSELDENYHLNNTVYADLVYDYAGIPVGEVESCFISFAGEALLGDRLLIGRSGDEKHSDIKCVNERSGKVCFKAAINFR